MVMGVHNIGYATDMSLRGFSQLNNIGYAVRNIVRISQTPDDRKADYVFRDWTMTIVATFLTEFGFRVAEAAMTYPIMSRLLGLRTLTKRYGEIPDYLKPVFPKGVTPRNYPNISQIDALRDRLMSSLVTPSSNARVPALFDAADHSADPVLNFHLKRLLNFDGANGHLESLVQNKVITLEERAQVLQILKDFQEASGTLSQFKKLLRPTIDSKQSWWSQSLQSLWNRLFPKPLEKALSIKHSESLTQLKNWLLEYQTVYKDHLHLYAFKDMEAIRDLSKGDLPDPKVLDVLPQFVNKLSTLVDRLSDIQLPDNADIPKRFGEMLESLKSLSGKQIEQKNALHKICDSLRGNHLNETLLAIIEDGLHSQRIFNELVFLQKASAFPKTLASALLTMVIYGVIASKIDLSIIQPWQKRLVEKVGDAKATVMPSYLALIPGLVSFIGFSKLTQKMGYVTRFTIAGLGGLLVYGASALGMIHYRLKHLLARKSLERQAPPAFSQALSEHSARELGVSQRYPVHSTLTIPTAFRSFRANLN